MDMANMTNRANPDHRLKEAWARVVMVRIFYVARFAGASGKLTLALATDLARQTREMGFQSFARELEVEQACGVALLSASVVGL